MLIAESRRSEPVDTLRRWRFVRKRWTEENRTHMHRVRTKRARHAFGSFLHATRLGYAEYVIQFDFHDVINTLSSSEEVSNLLITIDILRAADVGILGCSNGTSHIEDIFIDRRAFHAIVSAMDGWMDLHKGEMDGQR